MKAENLLKRFINIKKAWKKQLLVLTFLAILLVILSLVVWFHPKLGYAQSGIIKGADLRFDLIMIYWIMLSMFSTVSTLILVIYEKLTQGIPLFIWTVVYALGIYAAKVIMPLIDKYI